MAGFYTQFHATLDELGDLIEAWMDDHPIVVSAFAFPPESRVPISRETVREVLRRDDVLTITFTMGPVGPELISSYDVACAGLGPMQLNIGRLTNSKGLEQSHLSTLDPNPLWKKLNNQFKRKTTAGALYRDDATGASSYYRDCRFTPGAKALAAAGTPLRDLGGSTSSYHPK